MAKLYYNSHSVNKNVIQNIESSIDNLTNALSYASKIQSPYSFSATTQISDLSQNIINVREELKNIISWLNTSEQLLNNTNDEICTDLNEIKQVSIQKYPTIVNSK